MNIEKTTCRVITLETLIWHNDSLSKILNEINQAVEQNKSVTVFLGFLWDPYYPENFILLLEEIKKQQLPVCLLINSMFRKTNSPLFKKIVEMNISAIYIDFHFWRTYQEIVVKQTNKTNTQWNAKSDQFLFLTGQPNRLNRIGLLWKFYKKDLLKHAKWSLHVQDKDRGATLKILNESGVDPTVAEQFIDKHQRVLDKTFWPNHNNHQLDSGRYDHYVDNNTIYSGIIYDDKLYADAKFRVISETSFFEFITEKTWVTILNKCPFIMAGEGGSLAYLKSLGFRTFEKYLKILNYDNIRTSNIRLNAVVTNTEFWLNNSDFTDEIQQDVEHNYNHFIQLGKEMDAEISQQIQNNGLQIQLKDVIPTLEYLKELV